MVITLYQAIADISGPHPADATALGTLPIRACHAVRAASGFGVYCYAPVDWEFQWDGAGRLDVWLNGEALGPLDPGAGVQHPAFTAAWNAAAPAYLHDRLYPLLIRSEVQPNMLQMWTGWHLHTAPEWVALARPPANLPRPFGYVLYEGIVESGPLFASLLLTHADTPVPVRASHPLFQLQPLPRAALDPTAARVTEVLAGDWTDTEWRHYHRNVVAPSRGHPAPVPR
jgi:hypothetical protein